ncbi:MAG: alpha/beta hydrolase [Rhizomicrobium sp.]|jgi:pimeloyl-ACP methyl ester carboxylesterase
MQQSEPASLLTLRDGRTLAYLAVGPADGAPVFHFHGHGSSRLEALALAEAAARARVRLIAFDRPGIGWSDAKAGDRLLDWPGDVEDAADIIGVAHFAVQGMSAGGPYALACAHALRDRVTACSLVSAVPTPSVALMAGPAVRRLAWFVARAFPDYLRRRLKDFRPDHMTEEMVRARMARMGQWLGGEDLRLMQDPEKLDLLTRTMLESGRQGGQANRSEIERLARPWGFNFKKLKAPVFLFHGDQDRIMHVGPARMMARMLKDCAATFYPREGHFSVLVNQADALMDALTASGRSAALQRA